MYINHTICNIHFKCIGPNGEILYTDTGCPQNYKLIEIFNSAKSAKETTVSEYNSNTELFQNDSFDFDGFHWNILNVYRIKKIGRKSNLQRPKNDSFLIIEVELKNVSSKPRYYGDFILLAGEDQYDDDSTVSVYAKYLFNYKCKDSTVFEPGSKLKTFFGFDVKYSSKYTLLIKGWGTSGKRIKVNINQIRSIT